MKKNPTLQSTNNPKLFVVNSQQRPIIPSHVRDLKNSMDTFGFLPSKPIQCYRRDDGKLVIVDGHNRFAAASDLGISFYYVVEDEKSQLTIAPVNKLVRAWAPLDYIRKFRVDGNYDYTVLQSYIDRGLTVTVAASLLAGESAGSGNQNQKIKSGSFKVKTTKFAELALSLIEENPNIPLFRNTNFVKALSLALFVDEFDFGTFKSRAETNWHMIPRCSNTVDFLNAIEEVYNFRAREKQPIAHLAKKLAHERGTRRG